MKKCILVCSCLILAFSFISMSAFSQEAATCPTANRGQGIMSDHGCQKAGQLSAAEGTTEHRQPALEADRPGEGKGMMPMAAGHPAVRQMMAGMGRMAKRGNGYPMGKGLSQLGGPEMFISRAEKLELSDDQVDRLKNITHEQMKWNIQKRADIEVARVELEELLDDQPVNFDKIKAKISQIADLEKEMRLAHLAAIQKAHQVLTAEQLEKARDLRKHQARRLGKGPRQVIKEVIIEETEE